MGGKKYSSNYADGCFTILFFGVILWIIAAILGPVVTFTILGLIGFVSLCSANRRNGNGKDKLK